MNYRYIHSGIDFNLFLTINIPVAPYTCMYTYAQYELLTKFNVRSHLYNIDRGSLSILENMHNYKLWQNRNANNTRHDIDR